MLACRQRPQQLLSTLPSRRSGAGLSGNISIGAGYPGRNLIGYVSEALFYAAPLNFNDQGLLYWNRVAALASSPPMPSPPSGMAPLAAFSVRQVVSTYTGPVVQVRNGATGTTVDFFPTYNPQAAPSFGLAAADGTSYSAWIGAATGYVTTWCVRATSLSTCLLRPHAGGGPV